MSNETVNAPNAEQFSKANVRALFGYIVGHKPLAAKPIHRVIVSIDPNYSKELVRMSDGDIPAEHTNEVPVAIIRWEDFEKLMEIISKR